jgi:histidinol phosphatase-like enzyme (inositol monophosphatase family)
MSLSRRELAEYLEFAVSLTEAAGRTTLRHFRRDLTVERKGDRSPVTIADRDTERFMRDSISRRYPEHRILGEEHGETNPEARLSWIVDPIDGTKSFIRGVPLYTVLLALVDDGRPVLGVIHCPPLSETVAAASGLGCRYNGAPCRVSGTKDLSSAMIITTDYCDLSRRQTEFSRRLYHAAEMGRTWADGYGYLMVATGRAEAMVDPIMNLWDVAPLMPVITEAGGVFTDINGRVDGLGESAIAGNPSIHHAILALQSTKAP